MTTHARSRTLSAAGVLVAALAVLLVAWFLSGWADVRAQQRELRAEPGRAAQREAIEIARELRAELAQLITREADRPYFHYQNLFHDPRTGSNANVSPSPLANGPEDPLVLGYFQRDPAGKLTTPTINDDVPHLSEPKRLAENQRFRDDVVRGFVAQLEVKRGDLVAEAAPVKKPRPRPPVQRPLGNDSGTEQVQQQAKVVELDPASYAQNASPSRVYLENYAPQEAEQQQQRAPVQRQQERAPVQQRIAPAPVRAPIKRASEPAQVAPTPKPVMITISPLEWRTFPFAAGPALVAVRHVETPDGQLAQGFVIDRATLTSWLANRAGDAVAELRNTDDAGATEIAPGWHLVVAPNPRALLAAAIDSAQVARGFI
ncbi:MAG: hypothetical protein H0T89_35915, partial [Deltaproteobacteria bacterium]|nr:hypothetical protein [Deltaproteobacteria bacterium]